jgi:diguanylate cyclase (GGDEF)-like protein
VWFDVTDQRAAQERAEYLSNHDVLTGLPNRALLRELLAQGLALAKERRSAAAVAALDIDDFKRINDTLGIDAGDRLIAVVAQRIRQALRPSDSVARSSGDEFIIVRPDLDDLNAAHLTQALLNVFKLPFRIDDRELFVNASLGVSVYPSDGEDAEQLLARADAALVAAKTRTRGSVQFFRGSLQEAAMERLSLESELRHAFERREFALYYQPIFDVLSGKIVGAEALVRWNHPVRGLLLPDRFIPACEENGLVVPLGAWVLRTACSRWVAWSKRSGANFCLSVNVSPRQLEQDFLTVVKAVLERTHIPPRCLELEFTESALIKDQEQGVDAIAQLQHLGVRISIDDFGTGYSSLAYLKRLPVNTLKIDRLFVRDVAKNPYDAAIARAIVALAQSIDLRVIAEGVETVEQRDLLEALGCEYMQGYLLGLPMPADELFSAGADA